MPKKKRKRTPTRSSGQRRKSTSPSQAAEPAGDDTARPEPKERNVRNFETSEEVMEEFRKWTSEAPPEAMWRDREILLSGDRSLIEIEEVMPNDDPDKRRRITIETGVFRETDYDVALSFAGEDRAYVRELAERLEALSIKVFFDEREVADLWGRDLVEELVDTYRSRAFRVLMFVSDAYARKAWPTTERRAAMERSLKDVHEPYILPVRLDDTVVPGLVSTTAYVDGRTKTTDEIAELTLEHLRAAGRKVVPPREQRDMALRVSVRAVPRRNATGSWEVPFRVHNGGEYPIRTVVVAIDDPGRDPDDDQVGTAAQIVIGTMGAGEVVEGLADRVHFSRDPYFGEMTELPSVLFTDRWGNHWDVGRGRAQQKDNASPVC
jgi:hypothetical protein